MPATTSLSLIHKQPEGGNVWSLFFQPHQPLHWIAGQFIRIELPHPNPDAEGTKRYFTIASAPHERHVQITTRLTTSSFKQALATLTPGQTITLLDPPAGTFTWPANLKPARPLIFAAQGIGITPFYSMLRSRLHHGQPLNATLLYANHTTDIPFHRELTTWANQHPEFNLILQPGRLSDALLHLPTPLTSHLVYVAGPDNLITLLGPPYNLPARQLKHDLFPNYPASSY